MEGRKRRKGKTEKEGKYFIRKKMLANNNGEGQNKIEKKSKMKEEKKQNRKQLILQAFDFFHLSTSLLNITDIFLIMLDKSPVII